MDDKQFQAMRLDAQALFATLYLIDVSVLPKPEQALHKEALSAAYLALMRIENTRLASLNSSVKLQLTEVAAALKAMQEGVRDLASPHEKLAFVAEGLGVLANVAKVLS